MRVLCNGKTLAFQANDRGSIPLTRSNNLRKVYMNWEKFSLKKQCKEQALIELI